MKDEVDSLIELLKGNTVKLGRRTRTWRRFTCYMGRTTCNKFPMVGNKGRTVGKRGKMVENCEADEEI